MALSVLQGQCGKNSQAMKEKAIISPSEMNKPPVSGQLLAYQSREIVTKLPALSHSFGQFSPFMVPATPTAFVSLAVVF